MKMRLSDMLLKTVSPLVLAVAVAVVTVPAPSQAQDETEIRFSWWGGPLRNEKTDQILSLFEEDNPGVKVLRENSGWEEHWNKLTVQASAGNQPCTIQMQSRWLATYADPDILRPLDDLVEAGDLDVSGIAKPILDSGRGADGNLYMIPSGVFYFALVHNRTWLQNAGIDVPPDDWTWSDLAQLARDMKSHLPEGAYVTHNLGQEVDSFVNWVGTQGYPVFKDGKVGFPKDVVVDWFNYWEELRKEGLTNSPEVMVEEDGSLIEESNIANGRTFMTARPPNRLDSHQRVIDAVRPGEELGVLPYPRGDDGQSGMDIGTNGIAIGANCPEEKIEPSVAWINFFTQDPRAAAIYESDNGVVTVEAFMEEQANGEDTTRGQREQILTFMRLVDTANPVQYPNNGYRALDESLTRAYQAVAFEALSPDEAADQFLADVEETLS